MGLAKSFATGISLSEIEKSAIDQRDFVDSVTKQASTLRSQVDRCKALCEFSTASYLLRADAKTEKLETLRAAKARLEKKVSTTLHYGGMNPCAVMLIKSSGCY